MLIVSNRQQFVFDKTWVTTQTERERDQNIVGNREEISYQQLRKGNKGRTDKDQSLGK